MGETRRQEQSVNMDCEFSTSVEASRSREVACTQGCIKWPNRTGSRCQEPTHGESGKLDDTESGGLEGTKGVSNEGYGGRLCPGTKRNGNEIEGSKSMSNRCSGKKMHR